jgi:putative GTP pyrophosphokinase
MLIKPSMLREDKRRRKKFNLFKREFDKRKKYYESCLTDLLKIIGEFKVHNKNGIRMAYYSGRIKEPYSIIRKGILKNIPAKSIFNTIKDIVGIRIVLNNLKDINLMETEMRKFPSLEVKSKKVHSHPEGYRALHLNTLYTVKLTNGVKKQIPVEIQIRTLLQDVWAILAHHDIYKNRSDLPPLAKSISNYMSRTMAALDKMSNDFRKEIEAKVEPPNDLSDQAPLNREGLAFLFYEIFGERPEEYEVHWFIKVSQECGLLTVGEARKGMLKEVFDKIRTIHDGRFSMVPVSDSDLFAVSLKYSAKGSEALKDYKRQIEEEWAEVESIARQENLSGMPETFEEFIGLLKDREVPWEAFRELGGVQDCMRCKTEIFVPDRAAEGVLDFYGSPETDEDVEHLLWDASNNYESPFEPESADFSGVCSYCGHMMGKDD